MYFVKHNYIIILFPYKIFFTINKNIVFFIKLILISLRLIYLAFIFMFFIYDFMIFEIMGRDSSVGIATSSGLGGPAIESRWGRDFPHLSRPTQRPV
jgi:hypothetical protein